jgi:N6-adenosine-specific RNA methylase IME4
MHAGTVDSPRVVSTRGSGMKFTTVYADPPWRYSNTAARGAAENHYRTMSVEEICNEPVKELVTEHAHLHLWTTNAFLFDALEVIRAWGFQYKSCLIWVKPQLGMGNYWRVSHEYLLLGVRGNLPFNDRKIRSWQLARRTIHSRKPFLFRGLIEQGQPRTVFGTLWSRGTPKHRLDGLWQSS